jgi:hypothetical protein
MKTQTKLLKGASVLLIAAILAFSTVAVTADTNVPTASYRQGTTEQSTGSVQHVGQDIIWDNGGTVPAGNLYSSQRDDCYPFISQVADDFWFEEETVVTDFHWYGGFWGGTAFDPVDFEIYIYADDGTGNAPTGGGMPDPSSTALWTGFFPGVTGLPLDPNGFYSYEVVFDPPFTAMAGEKYWIAAVSYFCFPPQWGWANTDIITGSPSVQGFPFLGTAFWTPIDPAVDMAFYLTGEGEPPEPDLDCDGTITWEDVEPGATVTDSFDISNIGDATLNWEIDSFPDWGTWTFDPESGALGAGNSETIDVEVVAPEEENEEYEGEIKIINSDNPDDFCIIDVSLVTPCDAPVNSILDFLAQRFPFFAFLFDLIF